MDSVSVIDQPLVLDAVRTLVLGTFTAYQEGTQIKWNDAELAVYLVYVFGRIVVFAADSKTGGRLRQCLVGRKAYDPFFKAGTRSTPLKMKGSVYMACVIGAVPLSEDRVPCDCKAGRPAFSKSIVLSRRMWKLT